MFFVHQARIIVNGGEKMRQEKRNERNMTAITIGLCFAVIALASFMTVKSSIDKLNHNSLKTEPNSITQTGQPVSQPVPTVDSRKTAAETPSASSSDFQAPVNGEILVPFSITAQVYSKTLDQYMTHNGVDIAAPADTQVKAVAGGTVTSIYTDDKYGTSIEITHDNGYKSIYSNLSAASITEIGDVVTQGQVISGVGSSALFESLDEPHLHFELCKDGIHIDPLSCITF